MPRSSTLENPTAVTPAPGATDVIEAATAEAAIAEVHTRLGADARIVDARRVLRGGIGGFFAKEVVQLHAAGGDRPVTPRPAEDPSVTPPTTRPASGARNPWQVAVESPSARPADPDPVATTPEVSPVDRLLEGAGKVPDAIDFATFLRRQLADDLAATSVEAAASEEPTTEMVTSAKVTSAKVASAKVTPEMSPEPVSEADEVFPGDPGAAGEPAAASDGGPPWSISSLLAMGLPVELVRSLEVAAPCDDLAWTTALAEALRPSCRPLPSGPSVLLGPHAHLVGQVDGTPAARSETWLKALRGGRWLHLVVGGDGWRAPLAEHPLAASWARPEDLPDALRCAVELGLVLGFGPMGGRIRRARPLDVALAVRELLDLAAEEGR